VQAVASRFSHRIVTRSIARGLAVGGAAASDLAPEGHLPQRPAKAVTRAIGHPSLPRLDVEPIVQSVIDALESGELLADGALIRDDENHLRIKLGVLIPGDGPKETVRVRRERFRTAIEKAMNAIGWELIAISPVLKFKKSGPKADVSSLTEL
jgi:hypothetical protein